MQICYILRWSVAHSCEKHRLSESVIQIDHYTKAELFTSLQSRQSCWPLFRNIIFITKQISIDMSSRKYNLIWYHDFHQSDRVIFIIIDIKEFILDSSSIGRADNVWLSLILVKHASVLGRTMSDIRP